MVFGERLKMLRNKKKLTQEELANKLDVTKACISCYENSTREPSINTLIKLSQIFSVSIDYLVGFDYVSKNKLGKVNLTKSEVDLILNLRNNKDSY